MQIARQQQLTWPLGSCQQASLQQPTGAINAIPTALSAKALGQVLLGLGNSAVRLRGPISGSSGRSQGQGSATAEGGRPAPRRWAGKCRNTPRPPAALARACSNGQRDGRSNLDDLSAVSRVCPARSPAIHRQHPVPLHQLVGRLVVVLWQLGGLSLTLIVQGGSEDRAVSAPFGQALAAHAHGLGPASSSWASPSPPGRIWCSAIGWTNSPGCKTTCRRLITPRPWPPSSGIGSTG